jgi:hypothetical protein
VLRLRAAGLLRLDGRICVARPRPAPPAGAEAEERGAADLAARGQRRLQVPLRRRSLRRGGRRRSLRRAARRSSVPALRSPRAFTDRVELAPLVASICNCWVVVLHRGLDLQPRRPLAAVRDDREEGGEGKQRAKERAPEVGRTTPEGEGAGEMREREAGETRREGADGSSGGAVGMRHPRIAQRGGAPAKCSKHSRLRWSRYSSRCCPILQIQHGLHTLPESV